LRKRKLDSNEVIQSGLDSDIQSTSNEQNTDKDADDIRNNDAISSKSATESSDSELDNSSGVADVKRHKTSGAASRCINRRYNDNYLGLGFTWVGDIERPNPECIVCGDKLSNEAMVPSKLKRHFRTKHGQLSDKHIDYFKRLLSCRSKQALRFTKKVTISDKAQQASFLVAEIVAQQSKPHTVAEKLIMPACIAIVKTMLGSDAADEIKKVPVSDNTISRRIDDMSTDIESNLTDRVKSAGMFALQADESTDVSGKAQLLLFIRFVDEGKIVENFFCCKELTTTTTGQNIFDCVNTYLESQQLSWDTCVGICTDGAPAMVGSLNGFVALAKRCNANIKSTHCFLHREALVSKTIGDELKAVLDDVVKMVNYIKSRPVKSRLFTKLCDDMDASHTTLILHTEVRWLSRGRVLSRVLELKDEMLAFFRSQNLENFIDMFNNDVWCAKLAYLADIFMQLNKVNASMQGRNENILSASDKLRALIQKLSLWNLRCHEGNLSMFPNTALVVEREHLIPLICDHLSSLERQIDHYFPDIAIDKYDWLRNPFTEASNTNTELSNAEEEELIDIRSDRTLKLKHSEQPLDIFWIQLCPEFPNISKRALSILLQFATSYLCEAGFSTLTNIKTKKRERLLTVEQEMRVCLSTIRPRIGEICKQSQGHISH